MTLPRALAVVVLLWIASVEWRLQRVRTILTHRPKPPALVEINFQ